MRKKHKIGTIDYSSLNIGPQPHELETAQFFARLGFDITFLKPSNIKGSNNADFLMAGKIWETKSPIGKSRRTFEDDFRKAIKQSEHIIFDLRRKKGDEKWCIDKLKSQSNTANIKTLLVITKEAELFTIKGKFDIIKSR